MADITVTQLIAYLDALPKDCVAIETAVKNALVPIVGEIASTKNADLCHSTDALMWSLFNLETKVNVWAQKLANSVDSLSIYTFVLGGYVIPDSGLVVDRFNALLAQASRFESTIAAHNQGSIASAKNYLGQFIGAARLVIGIVPALGVMGVDGKTLESVLDGLEQVTKAV